MTPRRAVCIAAALVLASCLVSETADAQAPAPIALAKPPLIAPTPAPVHTQTLALASLAAGATSASMALSSAPTQVCVIYFASSRLGQDIFTVAQPCSSPLIFSLPLYTVFAAAPLDVITVVWW